MLGDLEWIKGCVPTPYGGISVNYKKCEGASVNLMVTLPDEIELVDRNEIK